MYSYYFIYCIVTHLKEYNNGASLPATRQKDILLYTDNRIFGDYYMPVDVYVWEIGQFIDDKTRGFTGLLVYYIILYYFNSWL